MIAFNLFDIIKSVIFSGLHGIFMGILFSGFNTLLSFFYNYFSSVRFAFIECGLKNFTTLKKIRGGVDVKNKVALNIRDFLFIIFYGISFLVLLYAVADGMFRLYILIISVSCCFITFKYMGINIERAFKRIFRVLIHINFMIFFLLFLPLKKLIILCKPVIYKFAKSFKKLGCRLIKRPLFFKNKKGKKETAANTENIKVYIIRKSKNNKISKEII